MKRLLRATHRLGATFSLVVQVMACTHSDPYVVAPIIPEGPQAIGDNVQLTFNSEQDYWPEYTEDGAGILYSFGQPGHLDGDRCVGLVPAVGGTRIWSMCEIRASHADSSDSFPAYALGNDGRLLYIEVSARTHKDTPDVTALWLADSAAPFERRLLITFPTQVSDSIVTWLADMAWTGPTEFIALAQRIEPFTHCFRCVETDSVYWGQMVVRGVVTPTGATLTRIPGTDGATSYSLAQDGANIVFTRRNSLVIRMVPAAGGTPTVVATIPPAPNREIMGIGCRGVSCAVATDRVHLRPVFIFPFPVDPPPTGELHWITLVSGYVERLLASDTMLVIATPRISPISGDIVIQVGGPFGHAQTFTRGGSDLFLFRGLLR